MGYDLVRILYPVGTSRGSMSKSQTKNSEIKIRNYNRCKRKQNERK